MCATLSESLRSSQTLLACFNPGSASLLWHKTDVENPGAIVADYKSVHVLVHRFAYSPPSQHIDMKKDDTGKLSQ